MTATLKKLFPVFLAALLCPAFLGAADQVRIRNDAPAQYEVVRGDTLWDISGRFLEDPWLWPEVWELNPQIENPHLIYPGDVIELQYSANGPLLTLRRAGIEDTSLRTVRLSPQVQVESLNSAIPAIPLDKISSLLSENIVVSRSEMDSAPYLLGNQGGTLFARDRDIVYGKGNWDDSIREYDIIRPGREYIDPATKAVLGIEGKMIGTAVLTDQDGSGGTLLVNSVLEEARKGDRFIPSSGNRIDANYFPIPPNFAVNGRILDIGSGRKIGNQYDSIVMDLGSLDRIKSGDLVALQKPDYVFDDTLDKPSLGQKLSRAFGGTEHQATFDGKIYATVLIYRVFDNTSLGIILSADDIVRLEDKVVTP